SFTLFFIYFFMILFLFFFFQAEDGIRDFHVTGVQTCALPICHVFSSYFLIITCSSFLTNLAPSLMIVSPAFIPSKISTIPFCNFPNITVLLSAYFLFLLSFLMA